MKIIAQMIGRNEADRHLHDVLSHLKPMVSEIVFTDDASTDSTPEIAAEYGAHVYQMEESLFSKDEGLLRQTAWNNLCNHAMPGDWVLAIDCDEKLYCRQPNMDLFSICSTNNWDVVNINFVHMWNETQYRVDKAWKPHGSSRLFRWYPNGKFKDAALACGSEPTYVQALIRRRRFLRTNDLVMQHLGYVRDEDKIAKHERYMKLDGGDFHALKHIESIIDPNPTLVDWNVNA